MSAYKHILAAVDLSKDSQTVLQRAVDLAQRYSAQLSLVHVVAQIIVEPAYDFMPPISLDTEKEIMENARKGLETLANALDIPVSNRWVEIGSAKQGVIHLAKEHAIDLIVVGSHGTHGLGLLLGSTANAILHGAPCDVLTVRIKA